MNNLGQQMILCYGFLKMYTLAKQAGSFLKSTDTHGPLVTIGSSYSLYLGSLKSL